MTASKEASGSILMLDFCAQRLSALGPEIPRDLSLLRGVQIVLDMLRLEHDALVWISSTLREETDRISALDAGHQLDKSGSLLEKLLAVQEMMKNHHGRLKEERQAVSEDTRLADDREELIDEYSKTISTVAGLHNHINSVRLAIAAHDAKYAKVHRKFDSIDSLKEFLDAIH